jgi:hypothetical protein
MVASIDKASPLRLQSKDDASAVHLIEVPNQQSTVRDWVLLLFPFFLLLRRGGVMESQGFRECLVSGTLL